MKEADMCFQHTKGHENVIASPKGVAIPPRLLHSVRNDKGRAITKKGIFKGKERRNVMSTMIVSGFKRFNKMLRTLEDIGISNVYFYDVHNGEELTTPIISLIPFVDVVVLGRDAHFSPHFHRIIDEANARRIPVISEECLQNLPVSV
ncbi:MAG: hypothetical protein LRZ90_03300 [Thermodesulfovibrionales bacterium]|nr:hypothetical protein [Thermodesulfovibrionales bacterium]